jgi:hypothetical protein
MVAGGFMRKLGLCSYLLPVVALVMLASCSKPDDSGQPVETSDVSTENVETKGDVVPEQSDRQTKIPDISVASVESKGVVAPEKSNHQIKTPDISIESIESKGDIAPEKSDNQTKIPNRLFGTNESLAVSGLRTYGSVQIAYAVLNNQQYGTVAMLVSEGLLDNRWLLAGESGEGFNGYYFTEDEKSLPNQFHLVARPIVPNQTGRYVYSIWIDMVVRYVEGPPGVNPGDPYGS